MKMKGLQRRTALLALMLAVAGFFAGQSWAHADETRRVGYYLKTGGTDTMPYRIVVRCRGGWAEDSAAHLKLVDFTAEKVIYRCRANGY